MILLFLCLVSLAQAHIYFLDSNIHIRVFSTSEKITDNKWDLIWYEYGHLSGLAFGVDKKIWSFGTFDFFNYQVLSLDVECSFHEKGCKEVPLDQPHAENSLKPRVLTDTYTEINAVEVTRSHLFLSWYRDSQDEWIISKFNPKSGHADVENVVPLSGDPIEGMTMDNSTVYWFTDQGDIFYGKLQGKSGKIKTASDNAAPRQIFWRSNYLWILYGNGTVISFISLDDFFNHEKLTEVAVIDLGKNSSSEAQGKEYVIPCMTLTNESLHYMVEEITVNITKANWTLHTFNFQGKPSTQRQIPDTIARLSGVSGQPYLASSSSFITDSDSVMTTIVTPDLNDPNYFKRGVSIFIVVMVFVSIMSVMVFYIAFFAIRE